MAQTYLTKTFSSSGNLDVWTVSFWVKKSLIETGSDQYVMHAQTDADNQTGIVLRGSGDNYQLQCFNAVSASANNGFNVYTSRYFRDASAWYHIVVACDTTESSGSNGLKIYVNGTQQSVTVGAWNQNVDTQFSKNQQHVVGAKTGNSLGFSGYLSQFIFANGTQYAASTFGSTNANGIWVPNTSPSVTYGTNGFKLKFTGTGTSADSSGFGADTSGNNNHFASNNLGTNPNTKDGPANNFCTLNPLQITASMSLSLGNLKGTNTANDQGAAGTMGFSAGKWYWEVKLVNQAEVGVNLDSDILQLSNDATIGSNDSNIKQTALVTNNAGGANDFRFNGSTETVNSTSCSNGDILMVAVDADNTKIYFGKNGTWMNSGDPAGGTGELKNFSSGYTAGNFITPTYTMGVSSTAKCEFNFGQPPFAIASSNADANGEGSFEYAVPSGYYALCTNNLALYGG